MGKAFTTSEEQASRCTSPEQIFVVGMAFSAFLAKNLTFTELQTLSNLLALIQNNLNAVITQKEICDGIPVALEETD